MSDSSPRLIVYVESLFSSIVRNRQEKRLSNLQKISEEIEQLKKEFAPKGNDSQQKVFTEKDLLYYLYLNPMGTITDNDIMNSPIAKNYFDIGILTQGVSGDMESQYRLTSFGRDQVKDALTLEMLS